MLQVEWERKIVRGTTCSRSFVSSFAVAVNVLVNDGGAASLRLQIWNIPCRNHDQLSTTLNLQIVGITFLLLALLRPSISSGIELIAQLREEMRCCPNMYCDCNSAQSIRRDWASVFVPN